MQHVIMAIHLMTVVALVTLILYQKSEGGALGLGQSGFFSGRGQANALTRATSILATVFFVTSVLLTVIPSWERRSLGGEDWTKAVEPEKVQLKEIKPEAAPQAQKDIQIPKEKESIFEQLKRAQEQRQQGAGAPALRQAPEAPAAPPPQSEPPAASAPKSGAVPAAPEPAVPKSEAPVAPKTEAVPTAPELTTPKSEAKPEDAKPAPAAQWKSPASEPAAPKSEAKPEDVKPIPEAAPAPSATPPAVQWKSPTK
ncbi:MAG: preprotein translocase subunit SecG [Methylocystis sp.]